MNNGTHRPWVVTGAAGFLGSYVVEHLLGRGTPVVGVDDLSGGRVEHLAPFEGRPDFTLARQDIRDVAALRALFRQHHPAAVVHLAALHFIPAAVADPPRAVSLNVHGTQCVLTAARDAEVGRFWFASTGDVYAPAETAHAEASVVKPFNIYGLTKLMGEQLIRLESEARPGCCFVVGRLFNLYGPRETNPHIIPDILHRIRQEPDRPLRLGSLWPRRDMVPAADAARAVVASLESARPGVTTVNVATGVAWSMQRVVELMGEIMGRPLKVEVDPAKVRPVERAHLQADVAQLRGLIGWAPHSDLRRGLTDLLAAEGCL